MSDQWRVKSPDEMSVVLSCGSVYIDHEYRDRRTGLVNLNLVGREVTATLHGLTLLDVASLGEMLLDWMIAQSVPTAAHAASDGGRRPTDAYIEALREAGFSVTKSTDGPHRALPSEVAAAMYGDSDSTNRQIAAVVMDRLEAAGMRIVRVESPEPEPEDTDGRIVSFDNKEVRDVGSFETP